MRGPTWCMLYMLAVPHQALAPPDNIGWTKVPTKYKEVTQCVTDGKTRIATDAEAQGIGYAKACRVMIKYAVEWEYIAPWD